MRFIISFMIVAALSLGLAACGKPDRKTADQNLLRACETIVKTLYAPEDSLEIQEKSFSDDKSHDGLELRKVHFMAHYVRNGGYIEAKEYNCWFEERVGFMGYLPKFFRLEKDGERYGNFGGTVEGDYSELLKIQQVSEDILMK